MSSSKPNLRSFQSQNLVMKEVSLPSMGRPKPVTPHDSKISSERHSPISSDESPSPSSGVSMTPDTSLTASPEPGSRLEDAVITAKKRKRSRLSEEVSLDAEIAASLQAEIDGSDTSSILSDVQSEDFENSVLAPGLVRINPNPHDTVRESSRKRQKTRMLHDDERAQSSIRQRGDSGEHDDPPDRASELVRARAGKARAVGPPRTARLDARRSIKAALKVADLSSASELSDNDFSATTSGISSVTDTDDEYPSAQIVRKKRGSMPAATNTIAPAHGPDDDNEKDDAVLRHLRREQLIAARISEFDDDLPVSKVRQRIELEMAHPEIVTMWQDLEKIPVIKPERTAQPTSINRELKSFQLEGLDWMMKQEKSQYKGGLLGDEMGMGKTIQAVSLIMSDYPAKQPTLVVVPPVALMQWTNEINDCTDGS